MNKRGTPENLSKPGMTNNPNGRPKGSGIRYWLKKKADEVPPEGDGIKSRGELLADIIWKEALTKKGKNIWSRTAALNHIDGNPPQQIQVEPISISFTYTDKSDES